MFRQGEKSFRMEGAIERSGEWTVARLRWEPTREMRPTRWIHGITRIILIDGLAITSRQ
jgi:hypothetical protein